MRSADSTHEIDDGHDHDARRYHLHAQRDGSAAERSNDVSARGDDE
jgi:hypothetical protein